MSTHEPNGWPIFDYEYDQMTDEPSKLTCRGCQVFGENLDTHGRIEFRKKHRMTCRRDEPEVIESESAETRRLLELVGDGG